MGTITVYTRQDARILDSLRKTGRHAAQRGPVMKNDDSLLQRPAYDWLVAHHPRQADRPADADYPVWISFSSDATLLPDKGFVILELSVDESLITKVNIAKWGAINNCSYLPKDSADAAAHRKKMEAMGVSDVKACTTQFYPELRQEIEESWLRLFDESVQLGNDLAYGLLWEIRWEWVTKVIE